MTHALTRTSPFGERFVGRCDKCGQEGFGMGGALEPCPMDHLVSDEQALLDCLSRDDEPARARAGAKAKQKGGTPWNSNA